MNEGNRILAITGTSLKYITLIGGAFIMVFPFIWMINASLMTAGEIQLRLRCGYQLSRNLTIILTCRNHCRLLASISIVFLHRG